MNSWYAINQLSEDEAEVRIYDEIGFFGVTAKQFAEDMDKVTAKTIHLRLNTPGGEVFDGTAIYQTIRNHPARVVSHIDGVAASAGSFIALAANEVRMADNAYMMIHEARGGVMGEADEMRKQADLLDKINDTISGMYSRKAGRGKKYWRTKMADESWFTAAEAKAEGLVDFVDAPMDEAKASAKFDFKIYNMLPEPVAKRWAKPNQTTAPEPSPCGDPAPVIQIQEPSMATENVTSPPAQIPAAVAQGDPQGDPIQKLTVETIKGHRQQARIEGVADGIEKERARMTEIVAVCPGDPSMAVDAFLAGYEPASVKLAFDAAKRARDAVESRASIQQKADALEIARLNSLLAVPGHPGVAMDMGLSDDTTTFSGMEPKVQAEWEWENRPSVRKTASSKDIYVHARTAELEGSHRSFKREPVAA